MNEQLQELISQVLGVPTADVNPELNFQKDLDASEFDVGALVIHTEMEFSIVISETEADSLQTVGDLNKLVTEKTNNYVRN